MSDLSKISIDAYKEILKNLWNKRYWNNLMECLICDMQFV